MRPSLSSMIHVVESARSAVRRALKLFTYAPLTLVCWGIARLEIRSTGER